MIANGFSSRVKRAANPTVGALPPPLSYPVWFHVRMNTMQKMVFRPGLPIAAPEATLEPPRCAALTSEPPPLELGDAIRIKSAELWLRLGWAELASRELEGISSQACRHPWTMRVQLLVWSALILE